MKYARGKITSGDNVLADGVDVRITKIPRGKQYDWLGALTLPGGASMPTGGLYRLELDDGRSGNILVTNMRILSGDHKEVIFQGSGPLK